MQKHAYTHTHVHSQWHTHTHVHTQSHTHIHTHTVTHTHSHTMTCTHWLWRLTQFHACEIHCLQELTDGTIIMSFGEFVNQWKLLSVHVIVFLQVQLHWTTMYVTNSRQLSGDGLDHHHNSFLEHLLSSCLALLTLCKLMGTQQVSRAFSYTCIF